MLPQTLYNIREDHMNILLQLEENDGELTEDLEQALYLTNEAFQDKAISYGYIVKTFDNTAAIIAAEIKRLKALQEKAEKRSEMFKWNLFNAMQQFHVEKITTATLSLSFRRSKAIEIIDETLVPQEMKEEVPAVWKISKKLIKEAIEKGECVPGATQVTNLNLQIK